MLATEGGRQELLNESLNSDSTRPRTTTGGLNLDNFIMGNADNNAFADAETKNKNLKSAFDRITAELDRTHELGSSGSSTSSQYIPGYTPPAPVSPVNPANPGATSPTVSNVASQPTPANRPVTPVTPTTAYSPSNPPPGYYYDPGLGNYVRISQIDGRNPGAANVGGMGGGPSVGSLGDLGSALGIGPGNGNIGGTIGGVLGGPIGGMIGNAIGSALGLGNGPGSGIGQGEGVGAANGGTGTGGSSGIGSGTGYGGGTAGDGPGGDGTGGAGSGIGGEGGAGSGIGGDGYSTGGFIQGPGTTKSDSIDARLSDGEYVIPAEIVQKYGKGFFDHLLGMNSPGVKRTNK